MFKRFIDGCPVMSAGLMAVLFLISTGLITMLAVPAQRAHAQSLLAGVPVTPLGYCQLTSIASATALSSCSGGIPIGANLVLIQGEAQNVRWRDDGTAPTASVGMLLINGQPPVLYNGTLSKLQFIQATATAMLDVIFYKTSSP